VVGELSRLFLAVPLDSQVKAMLAQHLAQQVLPGRAVPPDNWHLTVRFLGDLDLVTQERLTAELDQSDLGSSFEIVLGEMGAFPRPAKATVLWLAVDRGVDRLIKLNEVVEEAVEAIGLPPEDRPYAAHLTVSRIRPEHDARNLIKAYGPMPFRWLADELVLYRSHLGRGGAVYEPLESFPLSRL
jgi:2'-5' RNA ligase